MLSFKAMPMHFNKRIFQVRYQRNIEVFDSFLIFLVVASGRAWASYYFGQTHAGVSLKFVMNRIVCSRYQLKRRIGAGSFGEIYCAENIRNHRKVAIKLEHLRTRVPQLSYEAKLYTILSGGTGIPKLHWYGTEDNYNVMVIDLLGKSLEDLFQEHGRKFSLKTVLMLADQMISCVEYMHNKNFIHRDIKPDNFVMGIGPTSNQVFMIDFGLSKKYRDQHTHIHIPYIEGKSLTGTARYASVGALRGVEQSRRDDLESLGYVWLYLLRGDLPWMGIKGKDRKQKYDRICEVKARTTFEELCAGFPNEFVQFFRSVRQLRFIEEPDYTAYRQMFRDLFNRMGYIYNYVYSWNPVAKREKSAKEPILLNKMPTDVKGSGVRLKTTTKDAVRRSDKSLPQSELVHRAERSRIPAANATVQKAKPAVNQQMPTGVPSQSRVRRIVPAEQSLISSRRRQADSTVRINGTRQSERSAQGTTVVRKSTLPRWMTTSTNVQSAKYH